MALTQVNQGLLGEYAQYTGFKNRIINGAMMIDQRNAGASVTAASPVGYTLDRWQIFYSQGSKFTVQQNAGSVTPPAGFKNYLGATSSSAYAVLSSDYFIINQPIEGFNTADLGFGAAGAATVTLSFWVRSSLTGTFGGRLTNSAADRSYPYSYTISSANTWEYKTITIAGDTTGTWIGATNGNGLSVQFSLGAGSTYSGTANTWQAGNYTQPTGSTSVVGTNGATFYITGVQLEKGSTATSFDYRPYGTELALCQRYLPCYKATSGSQQAICSGYVQTSTTIYVVYPFKVTPRVAPTGATISSADHFTYGGAGTDPSAITFFTASTDAGALNLTVTGSTTGAGTYFYSRNSAAQIQFTGCEL